jgi:hypothetical protein
MRPALIATLLLSCLSMCSAQSRRSSTRLEAEYYVSAYANHYRVFVALVRAIIQRESDWQPCNGFSERCCRPYAIDAHDREAAGSRRPLQFGAKHFRWCAVSRLADAMFRNDLRLTAAAYYVGEGVIGRRGSAYRNPDVVAYVKAIRTTYLREMVDERASKNTIEKRDVK